MAHFCGMAAQSNSATFLSSACSSHDQSCMQCALVEFLLSHVSASPSQVEQACREYFESGHMGLIELYKQRPELFKGCAVEQLADLRGYTPLHYAAAHDKLELAHWLLVKGAPLDARSADGTTPLAIAALFRSNNALRLLLEWGANVHNRDKKRATPLVAAAYSGAQLFIESLTDQQESPFDLMMCGKFMAHINKRIACLSALDNVQLLVARGACLDEQDMQGNTALMHSVMYSRSSKLLVQTLISWGSSTSLCNAAGKSALMLAVAAAHRSPQYDPIIIEMLNKPLSVSEPNMYATLTPFSLHARERGQAKKMLARCIQSM